MPNTEKPCTCDLDGRIDAVLARHSRERGELIPILQAMQAEFGYIPPEALKAAARHLRVPATTVYGVVTFYAQFHLTPQGRHSVKVCQGTACHVRGSARLLGALHEALGVGPGETTEDGEFSLERVACFGSCALAPVMVVDGKVHGNVAPEEAVRLVEGVK